MQDGKCAPRLMAEGMNTTVFMPSAIRLRLFIQSGTDH
jgi:hypothetical protein